MVQLAHDAIQRHNSQPAMLYISLDQVRLCSGHLQHPLVYHTESAYYAAAKPSSITKHSPCGF
jgi:hypothetical protein